MPIKVYKRTDTARSVAYEDELLAPVVPGWPKVATFFDNDLSVMLRKTPRATADTIHTASIAILADDEGSLRSLVTMLNESGAVLHCIEEDQVWKTRIPFQPFLIAWKDARKAGAAMRGARTSAETKKAKTAAAFAKIHHDLVATKTPSKPLPPVSALGRLHPSRTITANAVRNCSVITKQH